MAVAVAVAIAAVRFPASDLWNSGGFQRPPFFQKFKVFWALTKDALQLTKDALQLTKDALQLTKDAPPLTRGALLNEQRCFAQHQQVLFYNRKFQKVMWGAPVE